MLWRKIEKKGNIKCETPQHLNKYSREEATLA